MAILEILKFPDPRLRTKAKAVTKLDDELRRIVDDMYETMYDAKGVGLAATQVNIHQQIFVMDVSDTRDQAICVLNPKILSCEGAQTEYEGCLSVGGGAYDRVERPLKIKMEGMDLDGKIFILEAEGLMASCIQHETDHLNGMLFLDRLSRLKQERIRTKALKSQR